MAVNAANKLKNRLLNPAWLCFTWCGLTAGAAMLAVPVMFGAPMVTRPIAVDIGREIFTALNKVELVALILLLAIIRLSGQARRWWAVAATIALIVLAQSMWLLPELAERAHTIVSGAEPPPSMAHGIYSTLELIKLALLLYLGFSSLRAGS